MLFILLCESNEKKDFSLIAILIRVLTIGPKNIQFYLIFCASFRGLPARFCINARICINSTSHLLRVKNRDETRDREEKVNKNNEKIHIFSYKISVRKTMQLLVNELEAKESRISELREVAANVTCIPVEKR
jgi:hypothetical protein